jgi:hypothetical protein
MKDEEKEENYKLKLSVKVITVNYSKPNLIKYVTAQPTC